MKRNKILILILVAIIFLAFRNRVDAQSGTLPPSSSPSPYPEPSPPPKETPTPTPLWECKYPYKITWPEINPVWEFCWVPAEMSSGFNGSGLEIIDAFYKGKKVFKRAHVPIVNVIYQKNDECGPTYRDWLSTTFPFESENVIQPGYSEPNHPPVTVCEHPGTDSGEFAGVAVEKLRDRIILTTQMDAGWYRYVQKWTFMNNGVIEPKFGFSVVDDSCVTYKHEHHAYWRFDFDIDGAENDYISILKSKNSEKIIASEKKDKAPKDSWQIKDVLTKRGYQIIRPKSDGKADKWADSDMWALLYNDKEFDDSQAWWDDWSETYDAAHISDFINNQNIYNTDDVIWYRAGYDHSSGKSECSLVGPILKPIGNW